VVNMPQLLADAQPSREPRLLGAVSPLRYYLPAAPVTLVATAAALIDSWRSGGDRRAIITAAVSIASAAALTVYLVRTVNLRLLHSGKPLGATECRRLVKTWHRGNLVRLLVLAVASWALRQAAQTADSDMNR
jgi:mannose/fructose/N-acetylgalactosamine-specific phosphotransferase system component IIC